VLEQADGAQAAAADVSVYGDGAAYRVTQESLTNTRKHAD
jgi:signal transduction histidine kinase